MFFVAEIGSNWEGNTDEAFSIIKGCKRAGINTVKFQMWRQSDLYPDKPEWKKYELTFRKAKEIKEGCEWQDMIFLCSPFFVEAVDFLEELKVPMYKIASRTTAMKDPESREVMEAIAETRKPVFISMGMGGDKKEIKKIFNKTKVFWLWCKSEYPVRLADMNWFEALTYDGISDHSKGITIPLLYSARKPNNIIEKHVKLNDNNSPDSPFSITTQELADFITLSKSSSLNFA